MQYIDPERHIDRCGREWNNNLHCYCEPVRRNQTEPFASLFLSLSRLCCSVRLSPSLSFHSTYSILVVRSLLLSLFTSYPLVIFFSPFHSFFRKANAPIDFFCLSPLPSFSSLVPYSYSLRIYARFVRQMSAATTNMRMTSGNRLELIVSSAVLAPSMFSRRRFASIEKYSRHVFASL